MKKNTCLIFFKELSSDDKVHSLSFLIDFRATCGIVNHRRNKDCLKLQLKMKVRVSNFKIAPTPPTKYQRENGA